MVLPHLIEPSLTTTPFLAGTALNEPSAGQWRILTATGHFIEAGLAASCLVAPTQSSAVLIVEFQQKYYILAVLTQPSATLHLEAQAICLRSESLQIQNKMTEMQAENLYSVTAEVIQHQADKILLN